ncbi:MAG: hypothetical protein RIS64_151 [Bacteroidota bacterium]
MFQQNFLTNYSKIENPTLEMVLFTFGLSFLLSALIAFTYDKTTQTSFQKTNFIQSLMLGSMVATMVLQSISDNVTSGLGMLGALSVVQFRNNFTNPRDIIFMFAAIGMGISCGLYGYVMASIGTSLFCILAFLLRFTPYHFGHHVVWRLILKSPDLGSYRAEVIALLNLHCKYWRSEVIDMDKKDELRQFRIYEFAIILVDDEKQILLLEALENLKLKSVRLEKQSERPEK